MLATCTLPVLDINQPRYSQASLYSTRPRLEHLPLEPLPASDPGASQRKRRDLQVALYYCAEERDRQVEHTRIQ